MPSPADDDDDARELEAIGLRLLPQSEAARASARHARVVDHIRLGGVTELLVVRFVADFHAGGRHGRVVLALVVRGGVRAALNIRGEALDRLATALERASVDLGHLLHEPP